MQEEERSTEEKVHVEGSEVAIRKAPSPATKRTLTLVGKKKDTFGKM